MPKKLTHHVVELLIRSGEYEKTSVKLVKASTPKLAGRRAVEGEMHHDFRSGGEWDAPDKQSAYDAAGALYYQVKGVKPVAPEDLETLRRYLR
jgi:hypothetical protein